MHAKKIWFVIMLSLIAVSIMRIKKVVNKDEKNYDQYLGNKIVFDDDTATVIGHSIIFGEFYLSNNKTVSHILIERNSFK